MEWNWGYYGNLEVVGERVSEGECGGVVVAGNMAAASQLCLVRNFFISFFYISFFFGGGGVMWGAAEVHPQSAT